MVGLMKKVLCIFLVVITVLMLGNTAFAANSGWQLDEWGWWYLNEDGSFPADTWQRINGRWYCFDEYGYMRTGWILDGSWYYCGSDGALVTGWVQDNGSWYYMYNNGTMALGWVKVDGAWYYMNYDGTMATGWHEENGAWYYLLENGMMATGKITVDGTTYSFNANGMMITDSYAMDLARNVLNSVGWDLYSAYKWSVNLPFVWEDSGRSVEEAAIFGFTKGKGDCLAKASTFCLMARLLGFNCIVIYGSVPYASGGTGNHAWTEITVDGVTYVCDPEFESDDKKNGYFIQYGQKGTWKYQYSFIVDDK